MTARDLRHLLLALTAVGVTCVVPIAFGAPVDLLLAAPVILVALPLLCGRYVGEDTIERLALAVAARRATPRRAARAVGCRRGECALPPRAGALLAFSFDVRPPPAAAAIS